MPVIYSTHELHPRAAELLAGTGELKIASAQDAATLVTGSRDADIIIVRAPLPEEIFLRATRLRAAIRHGAGLDWIPVEAATAAGVLVANVPGVNAATVAEHVLFGALAVLRRFRRVDQDLRKSGWLAGRAHSVDGHEIGGKTIGIIGMGNIGRHVARIAGAGFDMTVLAATRNAAGLPEGARARTLDDLIRESDVVVICCPLTDETRGMFDARRVSLMKQDAVLVNVARGAIVQDDALIEALRERRIGGAVLDVFAEQPLPADHPYFGFDNVVITPHMAGITEESMMRMGIGAAEETVRVLAGGLPVNLRNPEAVERYRQRFGRV